MDQLCFKIIAISRPDQNCVQAPQMDTLKMQSALNHKITIFGMWGLEEITLDMIQRKSILHIVLDYLALEPLLCVLSLL